MFHRFPHTPHLVWLSDSPVREDKVLETAEAELFLTQYIFVEEKIDGANIGFSLDTQGNLQVQQRGEYLRAPYSGQFKPLKTWLTVYGRDLQSILLDYPHLILFGEWCAAKHSVAYTHLPNFFLLFDVYDSKYDSGQRFWSRKRRDELAAVLGLNTVPLVGQGQYNLEQLTSKLCNPSLYHAGPPEGLVLRQDSELWCRARAKLVRPDFTQSIESHWKTKPIVWNGIDFTTYN
jgi:ATP-dependent RNA circularization protein (DNA/RNA ligase family)